MRDRYFEDWVVGERLETPSRTLDEASIVAFAREYDPQPFHVDAEQARLTPFGGLIASGWQTTALTMRLIVDCEIFGSRGGVGLGVDGLRWHKPVRPGDALRVIAEVVEARATAGKPSGVIHFKLTTLNQHDENVMTHTAIVLVPRRDRAQ